MLDAQKNKWFISQHNSILSPSPINSYIAVTFKFIRYFPFLPLSGPLPAWITVIFFLIGLQLLVLILYNWVCINCSKANFLKTLHFKISLCSTTYNDFPIPTRSNSNSSGEWGPTYHLPSALATLQFHITLTSDSSLLVSPLV